MTVRSSSIITNIGTELYEAIESIESYKALGRNRDKAPAITLVWSEDEEIQLKFAELLQLASDRNLRISVRFPRLTLDQITGVIFENSCVDPIVVSTFRLTDEKGLKIGAEWLKEIEQYDEQRLHSLILQSEHGFVDQLRDVIVAMKKRQAAPIPWDPYRYTEAKIDKSGEVPQFATIPSLAQLYEAFGPGDEHSNGNQSNEEDARRDQIEAATKILGAASEVLGKSEDVETSDGTETEDRIKEAGWDGRKIHLLVTGESGTGKSLVARLAHEVLYAKHGKRPFERVNCGGRLESDLEFELFGSTRGKYTGVGVTVGILARASYGTAFLDEFGDMPARCQPIFLTYLDDLMIRPKGEMPPFFSYSYVVAATNRDLNSLIRATEFRNDLVQRFARQVRIPSVRERSRKEILELIDMAAQHPDENPLDEESKKRRIESIAPDATQILISHEYRDGNIRELESIVHQALQAARRRNSRIIEKEDLDIPDYPSFRPDSERNVVNVKYFPNYKEKEVVLEDLRDLDRISERSGRPILKAGDVYGVILDQVLYKYDAS